jgi:hypothetical protein
MLMMAMMKLQHGKPCLILTFFESELIRLTKFLDENQLPYTVIDNSAGLPPMAPAIYLCHAKHGSHSALSDWLMKHAKDLDGEIYFPGHYPMHNLEYTVLTTLTSIGYRSFKFCLSFDDPLLKVFGSQNMVPLLEQLGLDDHESIEHNMVTQAIKRAILKVGERVTREIPAASPAEWFALNVKK